MDKKYIKINSLCRASRVVSPRKVSTQKTEGNEVHHAVRRVSSRKKDEITTYFDPFSTAPDTRAACAAAAPDLSFMVYVWGWQNVFTRDT
jgi:hypothetical protein